MKYLTAGVRSTALAVVNTSFINQNEKLETENTVLDKSLDIMLKDVISHVGQLSERKKTESMMR